MNHNPNVPNPNPIIPNHHTRHRSDKNAKKAQLSVNLPSLLHWRSQSSEPFSQTHAAPFASQVSQPQLQPPRQALYTQLYTYLSQSCISFTHYPQIKSSHGGGGAGAGGISSLAVDNLNEGRFVLVGSRDCTVSVHDLHCGSEEQLHLHDDDDDVFGKDEETIKDDPWKRQQQQRRRRQRRHHHRHVYPSIAKSRRIPPSTMAMEQTNQANYVPQGHSHAGR